MSMARSFALMAAKPARFSSSLLKKSGAERFTEPEMAHAGLNAPPAPRII
jgi:hypothetical protein